MHFTESLGRKLYQVWNTLEDGGDRNAKIKFVKLVNIPLLIIFRFK